jgi:hypothetical protein
VITGPCPVNAGRGRAAPSLLERQAKKSLGNCVPRHRRTATPHRTAPRPFPCRAHTTKGTGGDVLYIEEASRVDPQLFFEVVLPLLQVRGTALIAISTPRKDYNFFGEMVAMKCVITRLLHTSRASGTSGSRTGSLCSQARGW